MSALNNFIIRSALADEVTLPGALCREIADEALALRATTPRPKSRQDPAAVRKVKSYRVRPDTAVAIADEAKRSGLSQGQVIDLLAKDINK